MSIKISVIIPTYKRHQLLKKCLCHLSNQTLNKELYEIIIVSDGPDTTSSELVSEMAKRSTANFRFLFSTDKKGPAAARNLGWQNANGFLVAFTDDDCLPDQNWLKTILETYKDEIEVAYTGRMVVPVSDKPTDFELNTKSLERGEFVTANCAVTKGALQAIGGFDESFTMAWREDSDLHFKLINRGVPIIKLQDAIVTHPVREAPWGVSIKEQKKTMFNALLYKKYPILYRQRIKSGPSWHYYFIVLCFMLLVLASILKVKWLALIAFAGWFLLTGAFILRRLSTTRKTGSHIFEMIATSVVIPFLSIFWSIYGAVKYRVLFF